MQSDAASRVPTTQAKGSALEVFRVALKLGLTSFGGPVAHLGYFREEYVVRRRWLDERAYADLVSLCQFLPGPASSQVSIGVGTLRAGLLGGVAAWAGFTLPSVISLTLFAYCVGQVGIAGAGWVHGLKLAAVAIVALAVWGMARSLTPDRPRITLALAAAVAALAFVGPAAQVGIIVAAGIIGMVALHPPISQGGMVLEAPIGKVAGAAWVALFLVLLVGLPIAAAASSVHALKVFDAFYRAGSLVFGGGHVVLPMLQQSVVSPGWVSQDEFLAGYGAAQAVPGPLFTFAAFLGAVMQPGLSGVAGAALAVTAIFLPSFFMVFGALPFWSLLRGVRGFQTALAGINAAVVGLLLAALYTPVWTSAMDRTADFGLLLVLFGLLAFWKLPPWLVVLAAAGGGWALSP